ALIKQYRDRPAARQPAPAGRETSIDAALRHRLAAKDKEIAALKATVAEQQSTIELLYGQLDTLHEQIT
ncbi:transposase, partial [Mycolicibacterium fortuitum]